MLYKSHMIAQGSGTMGGTVFSHNSAGLYMRNWRKPVNPRTAFQTAVRDFFSQLATAWSGDLSDAQRAAWEVFGQNVSVTNPLGQTIHISGRNWYIGANTPRLQGAMDRVDDGPTLFELATFTTPTPTITAGGGTVSVAFANTDGWANEDEGAMFVYASRPQNNTINFFAGPYQYAGSIIGDGTTPPTSPAVITLPFVAGPASSKIFFRIGVTRADGRPSSSQFLVGVA